MAGGMGKVPRRDGLTLAERSAASGVAGQRARRHCWVRDPDPTLGEWPGVVVEWRRTGDVWQARVVWVVDDGHPVVVESWLDQSKVRPG